MPNAWDKTKVREGIPAPDLNDEIRENWDALETALNKEMNFATGGVVSLQGIFKQGGARMFSQASQPATRADGSAFASTDLGSMWIDTDNNKIYTLTAIGPVVWTLISTEVIATLLASARTFAAAVTFDVAAILSKAPTLTEGIVANDSYLQGRNQAGDGNVNLIKAGTNNLSTLPDSAEMASSAAPVEDEAIANKKYIDTNTQGDDPVTVDSESNTMLKAHAYLAQTSGYVNVVSQLEDGENFQGFVDTDDNPASGGSQVALEVAQVNGITTSVMFFVPKGKYFEITTSNSGNPSIFWTPLVTGGAAPIDQD